MSEIGHYMEACGRLSREVTELKAEIERLRTREVWVVTRDYETSAGGDDSEDISSHWSREGAETFMAEYLEKNPYERQDRINVYRVQVKP